uniref:maleylacetoacetate isomerase n=1 Tax=Heortia vitessoides TaxID=1557813 RepID=A0A3G1RJ84_9NEOP|nr:glutathione S-transferase zeta 2 [Heortia vitessoides]
MAEKAILYGFKLSSCSWRVRACLVLKKIPFEERSVDIMRERAQLSDQYRAINPAQKVPTLVIDGETFVESMAIIQYLEDTRPSPALTPSTPVQKARMREICETIVSGIQPLQNVGLKPHFDTEEQYNRFSKYWCDRGLQTLEEHLKKTSGQYCMGDKITIADLCLVPQLFNLTHNAVTRHSKHPTVTPTVSKLYESLLFQRVFKETLKKSVKAQT